MINVSAVLSSWRLIELLASGALLLLQEDADREVLKDWLVPWEHFIPVNYELSDLVPVWHSLGTLFFIGLYKFRFREVFCCFLCSNLHS